MDELTTAWLDFAVGGRPSRFMRSEVDWDRYHRFVAHVAGLDATQRPTTAEVRARLENWLPKRGEWVQELIQVYEDGLAEGTEAVDGPR